MTAVLTLQHLTKRFAQGEQQLTIWEDVNLSINPGEVVALVGSSGTGKTTLLQIAGLLDQPTSGDVLIAGQASQNLSDTARTTLRRQTIGFVYQSHLLLPEFSALENVVLPQLTAGIHLNQAQLRSAQLLTSLGLENRLHHRPKALSGGEQQRVALARALANDPLLLLADEPTGNLDPQAALYVFQHLLTRVRQEGRAAFIATHNLELAQQMDRVLMMKEGRVSELS